MRIVQGSICLEWAEAIKCGISENTLKAARQDNSRTWTFISDPTDNRILIKWDSMKEKYRDLVRNVFGEPSTYMAAQVLMPHLIDNNDDVTAIRNFKTADGRFLPAPAQDEYITSCKYLFLLSRITVKESKLMGFESKSQFNQAVCALIKGEGVKLPTNYSELMGKVRSYESEGASAVISKSWGNKNRQKIGEDQKNFILGCYADHRKPTVENVYIQYKSTAKQQGWPEVSLSTIKRWLRIPELRQSAEIIRDEEIWKQKYEFSLRTHLPTHRNALWESDGTKLNLFYVDEKGQLKADLEIYLVADIASEYILGYNISHTENHIDVVKSYQMAVNKAQHLPHQVKFDGGGAHNAKVTQEWLSKVATVHFKARTYNGQSKFEESIIGRWQKQVLKMEHNFTGQNIDAKADDSRLNKKWIKENMHRMPSKAQCISQAIMSIELWNNRPGKLNRSPKQRYELAKEGGRQVEMFDMVNLFWMTTEATVRKDGVTLQVAKDRFTFMVYTQDLLPDTDFLINWCGQKVKVKYDGTDLSNIHLYTMDDRFIAVASSVITVPRAVSDFKSGDRTKINNHLRAKDEQRAKLKNNVRIADSSEAALKMSHLSLDKATFQKAEADYLQRLIVGNQEDHLVCIGLNGEEIEENAADSLFISSDFNLTGLSDSDLNSI